MTKWFSYPSYKGHCAVVRVSKKHYTSRLGSSSMKPRLSKLGCSIAVQTSGLVAYTIDCSYCQKTCHWLNEV